MIQPALNISSRYQQIIKYIIAGGSAALTQIIILYVLTDLAGIWYLFSAILAFLAATLVGFTLQKFWTFEDKDEANASRQMFYYFVLNLINLGINTALLYLMVDIMKIWYLLAQFVISVVLAIVSFLVYKFIIFADKTSADQKAGIKILIATGIYPPDIGGPATIIKSLADCFRKDGFAVKVITYSAELKQNGAVAAADIIKISRRQNSYLKYLKYFYSLLKLARWSDIIYATDIYSVGYFVYLVKILTGKKYIIRFAGDSAWETAVGRGWTEDYITLFQKKVYDRRIEKLKQRRRRILVNADKVIAVSNFMASIAGVIGVPPKRIKVIYNSIDFTPLNKAALKIGGNKSITRPTRNRFLNGASDTDLTGFTPDSGRSSRLTEKIREQYNKNSKIIMTACRLTPWKGVAGIIKILPLLLKKVGPINFLILGDGQELTNLKQLAQQLKVSEQVHFLGRIKNEEVIDYFRAADLFILNTNYEGMSHTILEAMVARVPIITTTAGGNPELIEDNQEGLLVGYNNQDQLLQAALKVLTNKELSRALVAKADEKLKKFSWAKTVAETEQTINRLVA